jgi:2'-5' RNA ligase
MAESAFIVRVPEAESCVGPLRRRFDCSVELGVPAHITVLAPFMAPEHITRTVMKKVEAALAQFTLFRFTLNTVARFPLTAYLAPEPALPFIELTKAVFAEFPAYPPFGGEHASIVPHLTVAHGDAAEALIAETELEIALKAHGPIICTCTSVVLLENSSGRWKELRTFFLNRKDV